jgi:AraC family transcriptional regulator
MNSSSKSVVRCGPETLDIAEAAPRAHSSLFDHHNNKPTSPATPFVDQSSAQNAVDPAWTDAPLGTIAGEPVDHVVNSLSKALHSVELERDRRCADALRLAITIRLAGLQSESQIATRSGEADQGRRQIRALQKWRLKRVTEYVDNHLSDKIRLLDLAAVAGLSRMHFASQFRVATGLRPHEFLLRRRIRRSEELLRTSSMAIVEIALSVGFQTQAHFSTVFKRFVGFTPRQWRTAGQSRIPQQIQNDAQAAITAAL